MASRSLRASIDAKCRDCIYDDAEPGGWRQQVEACTVTACPLYEVRCRSKAAKANR
jgi:hypothetical protein